MLASLSCLGEVVVKHFVPMARFPHTFSHLLSGACLVQVEGRIREVMWSAGDAQQEATTVGCKPAQVENIPLKVLPKFN